MCGTRYIIYILIFIMQQQKPQIQLKGSKSHCTSWKEFIDRAMEILVQNPTFSKYSIKYDPKKHRFVLKVTDGSKIAIKKCNPDQQYDQVQRFTLLAGKTLSNQSQKKKVEKEQSKVQKNKKKKKK